MTAIFSDELDKNILIKSKALYMLCAKIDVDFILEEIITYFFALYINESSTRSMCQDYGYQLIQIAHNFSMHINMNDEYEIFILFTHRIGLFLVYLDDCSDYLRDFLELSHYIIDEGKLDDSLR